MIEERGIVALGDEGYLVAQVRQTVVDRRGGEHKDTRLDTFLDDAPHEAAVTSFTLTVRRLVAEVVGFVDDHEVVIAPIDMRKVYIARQSTITGKIGVV